MERFLLALESDRALERTRRPIETRVKTALKAIQDSFQEKERDSLACLCLGQIIGGLYQQCCGRKQARKYKSFHALIGSTTPKEVCFDDFSQIPVLRLLKQIKNLKFRTVPEICAFVCQYLGTKTGKYSDEWKEWEVRFANKHEFSVQKRSDTLGLSLNNLLCLVSDIRISLSRICAYFLNKNSKN